MTVYCFHLEKTKKPYQVKLRAFYEICDHFSCMSVDSESTGLKKLLIFLEL